MLSSPPPITAPAVTCRILTQENHFRGQAVRSGLAAWHQISNRDGCGGLRESAHLGGGDLPQAYLASGTGISSAPVAPSVPEPYCMVAATMSLELHGCGIHAV
jgi:hypothetical protein